MTAMVLSPHPSDGRRSAIASLFPAGATVRWVEPGQPLPDPGPDGAVVVDGSLAGRPLADLELLAGAVARGTRLVALGPLVPPPGGGRAWQALLGAGSAPAPGPAGEYVARVDPAEPGVTARLGPDIAVAGRFTPLHLTGGGARVVARVGYSGTPAVTEMAHGAGHAVACGLDAEDAVRAGELATLLRRALLRRPPHRPAPHTLAVLGYGRHGGMGYHHGRAAEATPGLAFVATCEADPALRKAAEHDFPGIRVWAHPGELAADDEVDVVVVATPPASHAALVVQMLEAGKHVVCEKPLCLTVAEADRLLDAAARAGRTLTVHQNRRFDADFLAVKRAVDAGLVGEVFNVETFVGGFEHPCRAWHSEVAVSGGAVYDWGSHHLDWVMQLLGGPPATVQTHGHKRLWHDVTNLDQVRVRLLWPDGREAEFLQSDLAAVRRPKFYVQGTAGTLVGHYRPVTIERLEAPFGYTAVEAHHAEAPARLVLARYEAGAGISETALAQAAPAPFAFHRNLADHLQLGEPLVVNPESARQLVAVLEAAQRSSDLGGRVMTPAGVSGPGACGGTTTR